VEQARPRLQPRPANDPLEVGPKVGSGVVQPWHDRFRAFLDLQRPAFEAGKSSPDFAPEDYEVDFEGRFTPQDLTSLGRRQMGY
jgi:hypothetical protein